MIKYYIEHNQTGKRLEFDDFQHAEAEYKRMTRKEGHSDIEASNEYFLYGHIT